MTRLKTAELITTATYVADRANQVRQDPAVIKAAKEAWTDAKQAGRSMTALAQESQSAWRRSERQQR